MVALRKPVPGRMTVAEFLDWDSGDHSGRLWQLHDGTPEAMAPPSEAHGAILIELGRLIGNYLLTTGSRCRAVADAGVVPRVRSANNLRMPDITVTCAPPGRKGTVAEPVLLIEILSPSNSRETWANVWSYTTIPSAQEILVVSSSEISAELLRREPGGTWPAEAECVGRAGTLTLASIGLELPLADLYRTSGVD